MKSLPLCLSGLVSCLTFLLSPCAASASPSFAQEGEEILSYDVTIEIQDGGRMVVTEQITVWALGSEIKRGIYRDFPTSFPRESGFGRIQAPFNVLSVERDGGPEPWTMESIGGPGGRGGVRARIGNANVLLQEGRHSYTLQYETWRWVNFGEVEDQLYWNVTGNGWGFPIRSVSARISIPEGADPELVLLESWTGPEGSTESMARAVWDSEAGSAFFETTTPLAPREGLTVRLSFPKGVVAPPSAEVEATWFRMDWGRWIDAAMGIGLILALYLSLWVRVGRDPARGVVVVRYEPPSAFSPAALGYLKHRGYHESLLSATLVSLAVKGALTIDRDGKVWSLHHSGPGKVPLSSGEENVLANLMMGRRELRLTPSHSSTLQKGIKALKRALSRELEKQHFERNRWWFATGLCASALVFLPLVWRDRFGIAPEASSSTGPGGPGWLRSGEWGSAPGSRLYS